MIDWNAVRALLERTVPEGVAAWRRLPELLRSGRLAKGSGGWYRLKDPSALEEVRPNVMGYRISNAGKLTHVLLSTPTQRLIDFADRLAAREQARAAVSAERLG